MRFTIINDDKFVAIDKIGYSNLQWSDTPINIHALQWFEDNGWIEYSNNELPNLIICELPEWAINAKKAWQIKNDEPAPLLPTIEQNTEKAKVLLQQTEWILDSNVINPLPDAYRLENIQEFLTFRKEIENIIVSINAGPIEFPIMPESIWVTPKI